MKSIITLIFLITSQLVFGQTLSELENIKAFNRLYGYVKYFHPSDEAANLDWDAFAVYGCKAIENCKNPAELQKTLMDLFHPIAPTLQIINSNDKRSFSGKLLTPSEPSAYKTITWQHLGLGVGNSNNAYHSVRLNRKTSRPLQSTVSIIRTAVEVGAYQGKEFVLSAKIKLSEGPGSGHLWAAVERPNSAPGFFDNMENRPITANEWQQYEIKGTIDSDGTQLAFGCFLKNKGMLLVDDINLKVREGSAWNSIYANSFETDALNNFPKTMSGNHAQGYTTMVTEKESSEGKKSVFIQNLSQNKESGLLFERYCQIGEYVQKEIGSGLTVIMPLALYGNENSTYPKANPEKLLTLENQLKNLPGATTKDLYVRLGDLVITWNIFQHFYPYFAEVKTDWNEAFSIAVKEAYSNQTEYDFSRTLRKFTAKLKDGHVRVMDPSISVMEDFLLPLSWEWVEDQLVITHVLNDSIPIKTGDIVSSIDEQSPQQYFEKVYTLISSATTGWLKYMAQLNSIRGPRDSKVVLTISNDKGPKRQVVVTRNFSSMSQYFDQLNKQKGEAIKKISDDVHYINISEASMDQIRIIMNELQQAKAIICDLRGYPNSNHELIAHFLEQNDTSKNWMRIPQIIYPDQEKIAGYREMGWMIRALQPHLKAKIFFIIDGQAISYAESFLSFIEHYKLATIIGQPSAGTNGDVNRFTLPGAIQVVWTGLKVVKHDGSQHHGVGILPNVHVEKTIKGVREQRDEFLDKAMALASKVR